MMYAVFVCILLVCFKYSTASTKNEEKLFVNVILNKNSDGKSFRVTNYNDFVPELSAATATYSKNVSGWGFLSISTAISTSTEDQLLKFTAAGVAEGYLTCEELRQSYPNFYADNFGHSQPPSEVTDFIITNYNWMVSQSEQYSETSNYWLSVKSSLAQLQGILIGYLESPCLHKSKALPLIIPATLKTPIKLDPKNVQDVEQFGMLHLLLLNSWGDLYNIMTKYSKNVTELPHPLPQNETWLNNYVANKKRLYHPESLSALDDIKTSQDGVQKDLRCSSLFKMLPNYEDIIFGHASWASFLALGPRTFKQYLLPTGFVEDSNTFYTSLETQYNTYASSSLSQPLPTTSSSSIYSVELRESIFSSSPGLLASLDDFYIVSSPSTSLAVIETTNDFFIPSLYDLIVPELCLCWIRAVTANAVARNGPSWAALFAYLHSGTYPNQWQVLDMTLFTPGQAPGPNLFTVLEEIPGLVVAQDLTEQLVNMNYWPSYNVAYFKAVSVQSGTALACQLQSRLKGDQESCWATASRASIFNQRQSDVRSVEDLGQLLYLNDWKRDPLSEGDPCKAIACRRDLEPSIRSRYPSGLIDAKVSSVLRVRSSSSSFNNHNSSSSREAFVLARMGPTNDIQPTFCWSNLPRNYVHLGQPDCFDYEWTSFPL
mmetsp:Transcript_28148/g.38695  ORF Transcript_28148/g.38695 Transcript_28148/m.38695 type:complete len:658 (+) Transcript_28148:3-1976(+)